MDEYWLVDPDPDIFTIYRRGSEGFRAPLRHDKSDVVTTPLLPGFELPLAKVLGR